MNAGHSSSSRELVDLQRYLEPITVCLLERGKIKPGGARQLPAECHFNGKCRLSKYFVRVFPREFKAKTEARHSQVFYVFGLRHSQLLQGTEIQVTASFLYKPVLKWFMSALDALDAPSASHLLWPVLREGCVFRIWEFTGVLTVLHGIWEKVWNTSKFTVRGNQFIVQHFLVFYCQVCSLYCTPYWKVTYFHR